MVATTGDKIHVAPATVHRVQLFTIVHRPTFGRSQNKRVHFLAIPFLAVTPEVEDKSAPRTGTGETYEAKTPDKIIRVETPQSIRDQPALEQPDNEGP